MIRLPPRSCIPHDRGRRPGRLPGLDNSVTIVSRCISAGVRAVRIVMITHHEYFRLDTCIEVSSTPFVSGWVEPKETTGIWHECNPRSIVEIGDRRGDIYGNVLIHRNPHVIVPIRGLSSDINARPPRHPNIACTPQMLDFATVYQVPGPLITRRLIPEHDLHPPIGDVMQLPSIRLIAIVTVGIHVRRKSTIRAVESHNADLRNDIRRAMATPSSWNPNRHRREAATTVLALSVATRRLGAWSSRVR